MAKYLDDSGLSYFWEKLKNYFSIKGHTHTVSVTAGTAASLTTEAVSVAQFASKTVVTGVTPKTVVTGGTTTDIPNVTSKGTAAKATFSGCTLTLTDGATPTLGTAIKAYTTLSTGQSATVTTGSSVNALQPATFNAVGTFTPNTPTAVGGTTGASTN